MPNQWLTLVIAVLGLLHGPLGAQLINWLKGGRKPKP